MVTRHSRRQWLKRGALFIPATCAALPAMAQFIVGKSAAFDVVAAAGGFSFVATKLDNNAAAANTVAVGTLNIQAGDFVSIIASGTRVLSGVTVGSDSASFLRRISLIDPWYVELYYCANCSANASATVTATFSGGTAAYRTIEVSQFRGVSTSSPADGSASNRALDDDKEVASTNRTAVDITTTNATDLLVGHWINYDDNVTGSAAATWTFCGLAGDQIAGVVYKTVSSTGTYPSGNFGTVNPTNRYVSFISAYKLA